MSHMSNQVSFPDFGLVIGDLGENLEESTEFLSVWDQAESRC